MTRNWWSASENQFLPIFLHISCNKRQCGPRGFLGRGRHARSNNSSKTIDPKMLKIGDKLKKKFDGKGCESHWDRQWDSDYHKTPVKLKNHP